MRVFLGQEGRSSGFVDLCPAHKAEFTAECQRANPEATEKVVGRITVDEDGNQLDEMEVAH
jgi:hypothetical protein